ncbi:hypothetical protein ABID82_004543 [Methylobacterium sp. PvP062]|uniref:Uncharacterized protein n=1 Tax=Methylobacterium radiotolerans TaxID=31998 RepID=A0ABV2NKD4_9HYPH|nr:MULTISPECIES: hypothetical protein [Methylobacterium]MBP2496318.1 hypothetical protein [Methylobacterium sp. PvP105]MBP2503811.1 hypothetical protein [Methylobacterium sp. PvP109]MCX7334269.1 hypothetical protein [Hyphomicrobiales bacterium]ONF51089.1 hypothetical protein RSM1_01210 [Methylobacterium radiotolerans]
MAIACSAEAARRFSPWSASIRLVAAVAVAAALPLCGCVSTPAPTADIAVADPSASLQAATMRPGPDIDASPSRWRLRLTRL